MEFIVLLVLAWSGLGYSCIGAMRLDVLSACFYYHTCGAMRLGGLFGFVCYHTFSAMRLNGLSGFVCYFILVRCALVDFLLAFVTILAE